MFLSLYIESNITERDDVKEFIKFAISNSDLDRDEVLAFIKDAKPSKEAVVFKNNQPEVKATWDSYRNTRVSATRIINGLKFLLDHKILLENVKDFGVSKFYIVSIIGYKQIMEEITFLLILLTLSLQEHLILKVNIGKTNLQNSLKLQNAIIFNQKICVVPGQGPWDWDNSFLQVITLMGLIIITWSS